MAAVARHRLHKPPRSPAGSEPSPMASVRLARTAAGPAHAFPFRERRRVMSKYSFNPIKMLPSE